MDSLLLGPIGRYEVGFTLHLRAPDRDRRATTGPIQGDLYRGRPECTTWLQFRLRAERLPHTTVQESVRVEPAPALTPEDGPALQRCAARALAFLPTVFVCDPQDREDLTDGDPHHLMAFLEPSGYETVVAVLGYYALGFGADYPFMSEDSGRAKVHELVRSTFG